MRQLYLITILIGLIFFGCEAPQKYREVQIGMASDDVFKLLGNPDKKEHANKKAPTQEYFGPKFSLEYLSLLEGTPVEIWHYQYFKEKYSYVFNLDQDPPRVVHVGYYHPDIIY